MDRLRQDVRYALRTLRRDAGFSAMIVLTLAIGIGVNTAVFSVVRSVLLEPLPYEDADRLVMVWSDLPAEGVHEARSSYANVQDWRAGNRVLEDLALFDGTTLTLTGGEWPERISGVTSSANLFSLLGAAPALGRTFSAEEEALGAPVVVLSDALWRRRFGASPDAIGRDLEVGGVRYEVIGVMPEEFSYPDPETQLWLPLPVIADGDGGAVRGTGPWTVIGRMRPGVTLEQARGEMSAVATRLEQAYPDSNAGLTISLVPLRDAVTGGSFRLALWTLFGAVGLVLLIACANGAHMILVRGINRSREVALRIALGAGTGRIVRQALTESMVLSTLAGVVGILLALGALRLLVALAPAGIPRLEEVGLDPAVLVYATGVSVVVGILFGMAPVLGFSRGPLAQALREGRSASERTRGQIARKVLIVFQFALAIVLVFGASLLIRSLVAAGEVDHGFDPEGVLMANLSVQDEARRLPFYDQVVREVGAIPGVEAMGIVEDLFISGAPNLPIAVEGSEAGTVLAEMRVDAIAGDFFRTMGVPLRAGRTFSATDGAGSVPVAVVNETLARRFWPNESPVGKRLTIDGAPLPVEVVGVVGDMRRAGPEREPIAQMFVPYEQAPSRNMILLVRAGGSPEALAATIRTRLAAIDRTVPLYRVTTVDEAMDGYLTQRRFQTLLLGLFSSIALLLAAVGVYGLIQYSVSQRTREIGVRMALGGTPGQVVSMVLRQGLALALTGLALGMVCALLLSRALSALLFGVGAADPLNILLTSLLLLLTTLLACWLPARRAARIDPMEALRYR